MKMKPFIVYTLPRSRTYWLSKFLAYQGTTCFHDICAEGFSIPEIKSALNIENIGIVDTGLVEGWRLVKSFVPDAKIAVIHRSIKDVCNSLKKFGIDGQEVAMIQRSNLLHEVCEERNVFTANFNDLNNEETIKGIFEHCLEKEFDRDWWLYWKDKNIQIDMPERLEKLAQNHDKIEALKSEAARMVA